jgi:hypothetical protein
MWSELAAAVAAVGTHLEMGFVIVSRAKPVRKNCKADTGGRYHMIAVVTVM